MLKRFFNFFNSVLFCLDSSAFSILCILNITRVVAGLAQIILAIFTYIKGKIRNLEKRRKKEDLVRARDIVERRERYIENQTYDQQIKLQKILI